MAGRAQNAARGPVALSDIVLRVQPTNATAKMARPAPAVS